MTIFRSKAPFCFLLVVASLLWVVSTVIPARIAVELPATAQERLGQPMSSIGQQTQDLRSSTSIDFQQSESESADDRESDERESIETANPGTTDEARIAHGKYLVHHVAQCIQCHTPRDERGMLIRSKLLTGAPIPVVGPRSVPRWAVESAWIAGLGSYDDAFVRYLLTHGRKPDGSRPRSPMPSFKMTDADAAAVIAYLRSL